MCKRVVLTEMGEALLHHAEHGLKEFEKAREALDSLKDWGATRLRVGAGAALSRIILPAVLSQASQQHRHLRITARVVRPWETVANLADGELDIILGEPQKTIPEIAFAPLFESHLQIIVGADHRWAKQGRITPGELAKEPCLLTSKSHPTRQLIDRYFFAENIEMNAIAEIDSFDAIKELVKSGIGISVLPQWAIQEELATGVLIAFPPGRRTLNQTWGIYRWKSRPVTRVENTFHVLCGAAAGRLTTIA
jgi:DNA-binding transcriptional LysR family regulator